MKVNNKISSESNTYIFKSNSDIKDTSFLINTPSPNDL